MKTIVKLEREFEKEEKKYTLFYVACFPIKITGAGAAWTRAVAIYI